jgi:hypothetical protein
MELIEAIKLDVNSISGLLLLCIPKVREERVDLFQAF